jgi:hypothetical protein
VKKLILYSLIASIAFSLSINKTFAWGRTGHSIVAQIAFNYLDKKTKANVMKYLDTLTIEQAASWMDNLRNDKTYDYLKPYHYINIEKGENYTHSTEDNIINGINNAMLKLDNMENLSKEEITLNLLILFHLIGDLHQPLHCGYGVDKGGNTVQVSLFGKGSNLHRLWDSDMIEYKKMNLDSCLKLNSYTRKQIRHIKKINVVNWMNESRSHLTQVYNFSTNKIEDEYINYNSPLIKKQLLDAGLRLAKVLKKYFHHLPCS